MMNFVDCSIKECTLGSGGLQGHVPPTPPPVKTVHMDMNDVNVDCCKYITYICWKK